MHSAACILAWGQFTALMLVFISQKIILNRTVHISDKSFSVTRDPSRAAKWYSWGNCTYSLHAYKHIHRQDRSSISLEPRCCWPQGLTERCVDSRRGVDMGKAERERGVKKKKHVCVWEPCRGERAGSRPPHPLVPRSNQVRFQIQDSENGTVNIFDRTCFFIYNLFSFKADTCLSMSDKKRGTVIVYKEK